MSFWYKISVAINEKFSFMTKIKQYRGVLRAIYGLLDVGAHFSNFHQN